MLRVLHRWPGLIAALLAILIGLSGAALSVYPALDAFSSPQAPAELTVAELARRVQTTHPGLEQIKRAPSGRITAWWFADDASGSALIDPATGVDVAPAAPDPTERWLTNLHRSLFLGDGGRMAAAIGAGLMLALSISGVILVARRAGGWRRWFAPSRGTLVHRLHTDLARIAAIGLILSSTTALWMSAQHFGLMDIERARAESPVATSGRTGLPVDAIPLLVQTPVSALRDLTFPAADDPSDAYKLNTESGSGHVDQGDGAVLNWVERSVAERFAATVTMLHTGRGAAVLGLFLGLSALAVPALGVTGILIWLAGRRTRPRIAGNIPAEQAGTVILVGSEGGATWGFAATLHKALTKAGQSVHVGPMASFDLNWRASPRRCILLAAAYGDGDAPESAKGFLERLGRLERAPAAPVAILGFGDRSFPAYCAFAEAVKAEATRIGWAQFTPFDTVDRQSPQDFARWGRTLGASMGVELELSHQPVTPQTCDLALISRRDYGAEVQAPTAILRFALPRETMFARLTGRGFGRFQPGDLLGVLPEGSTLPRFYSLASGTRDGLLELVVRKQPGGLCSSQLTELEPGQTIRAFLRPNPGFHAGKEGRPLILIGAGAGVAPLAGMVRANTRRRPVQVFFGLRHPASDFLYKTDWRDWASDGRLGRLVTAVSRSSSPQHVQDALRAEAQAVAQSIAAGARIMVCGGRDMARGVSEALTDILAPIGLTPAMLKAEGRYVEDVY